MKTIYLFIAVLMVAAIQMHAQGCSTCGSSASSTADDSGPSLNVSLGKLAFGQSAGTLGFTGSIPTGNFFSSAFLQLDAPSRNLITIVTNTDGTFRQVYAPQIVADIPVSTSTNGYVINFYYSSQVTGQTGGIYQFSGAAFSVWMVTNTDSSSLNQVQISESMSGSLTKQWTYTYDTNTSAWTVQDLAGIKKITTTTNLSSTIYRTVATTQYSGGPVALQTIDTYQTFSWGFAPIESDLGATNAPESTLYTYYDPAPYTPVTRQPLRTVVNPDGSWQWYANYDAAGNPTNIYSSFGDITLSYATNNSGGSARQTVYTYSPTDAGVSASGDDGSVSPTVPRRTIVFVQGHEISRSYSVFPSVSKRIDVQCVAVGAAWNAAGNLYTTNTYYSSGGNQFAVESVVNPDKTISAYDYRTNSFGTYRTNITVTGQPDSGFTHVVDGTTNYVVLNQFGYKVAEVSADVKSGMIFFQDTYGNFDGYGRPQQVTHLDGTTEYTYYACCGLDYTVDRDGVVTQYLYDQARRQTGYIKELGTDAITYTNVLDAAGRILQSIRIGTDGSPIITSQNAYDTAGEVLFQTNALGGVTSFVRSTNVSTGGLIRSTAFPDGGNSSNCYYLDGALKQILGSAARPVTYVYGSDSGDQYTITYKLDSSGGSNEWEKAYTDMIDRAVETLYASSSGSPATYSSYNAFGQLTNTIDPDGVSMLYAYNAKGQRVFTVLDTNQNYTIDFTGSDRIAFTTNDFGSDYGANVRRTQTFLWSTSLNVSNLVSSSESTLDGLKRFDTMWNGGIAVVTTNITIYSSGGYRYTTNLAPDGSYAINTYQYGRLILSLRKDSGNIQLSSVSYSYDAHGRQYQVTDVRNGATTYLYNSGDQVSSVVTPSPAETATYYFDKLGRGVGSLLSDGTAITNVYYPTGDLAQTRGSRTYPVGYGYDAQGHITKMTNWTSFASNLGARVTTWAYDQYRGFVSSKTYDGGASGPSYAYTSAGRLYTRTWARGITTTYAYDHAGGLTGVSYSDSTPGVIYAYDRRGRQSQIVVGGNIITAVTYNDHAEVLAEAYSGGPLDGLSVTNGYDFLLRRTNVVSKKSGVLTSAAYTYDGASRLATVSDSTESATYSYLANSPLVANIVFAQSGATRMTTFKQYDNLNRLISILSSNASSVIDEHDYNYNSANLRTSMTNADGTYWVYQYDALGQVTSGIKNWANGGVVAGQQFGYGFDDIGNRIATSAGGDQWGANLRYASYTANNLNQYTSRTVSGAVDVIGSATNTATVTVNDQPTYRNSNYFRAQVSITNSSGPVWQTLTNLAVLSEGTNYTIQTNILGNVYVPRTPESFNYDADGNLTNDGRWQYVWDGENRLISMTNNADVPVGARMGLIFTYDFKGRRISKSVVVGGVNTTLDFVYDGWNLLANLTTSSTVNESFTWGTDLSGSTQGAGGVGGLLFLSQPSIQTAFVSYDGNGNVSSLVNAANGNPSANYEYGPFGELMRATGSTAKANPFRFSTKYQDDESDLIYYGYRYYNVNSGRWISRDVIQERGGANLYSFAQNNAANLIDRLGLDFWQDPLFWQNYSQMTPLDQEQLQVLIAMLVGGGGSFAFGPDDPWTQTIANSSYISSVIQQIQYKLSQYCKGKANAQASLSGRADFDLNELQLWDTGNQIINDAISWLTFGEAGTDPAFLFGSYRLRWSAVKHDCCKRTAKIAFFGSDQARLGSAGRIPYTPVSIIPLPDQPLGPGLPGQNVSFTWTWTKDISW
ncbi:MAG TPA: RHS repeat-associated core domain-containing protein [Verrucomicrobiae bacterium]|jgi:RHS repeat-associated protein|nr:RHS repeat-associated core domain-containing protein [Verrucomicrobiae bacterium]